MKLNKILIIFVVTLVIGVAAFFISTEQTEQVEDQESGQTFLSGLSNEINSVDQIVISEKTGKLHLKQDNGKWILLEKSSYPADFGKIKQLLLSLSDLKTIESKTSKPESYGRLGVQKPGEPGDVESRQIDLLDKAGNVISSIIVGKAKVDRAPGGKPSFYARKPSEEKSWLLSGELAINLSQTDWLDKSIINLSSQRIKSVDIKNADNDEVNIAKSAADDKNFKIVNLPKNAEMKSESIANPIATSLQNLTFEDVQSRASFNLTDKKSVVVTFETFDGLTIIADIVTQKDKHYILLDARFAGKDEKLQNEAKELNARFAEWVYEIPEFKAKAFSKSMQDLLKTKESKKDK